MPWMRDCVDPSRGVPVVCVCYSAVCGDSAVAVSHVLPLMNYTAYLDEILDGLTCHIRGCNEGNRPQRAIHLNL